MIDDINVISIYLILLNRKPYREELNKSKLLNLEELKLKIKSSDEFSNLKTKNIKKIKEIVKNILNIEYSKLNYEKLLKILINYKYNFDIFESEFKKNIEILQKKTEDYYLKNIKVKKQLSNKDIVEVINNDYKLESYIPITDDFASQCRIRIKELTNQLPC